MGISRIVEGVPTLQVCRETNRGFFVFFFPMKIARDHIQGLGNSP